MSRAAPPQKEAPHPGKIEGNVPFEDPDARQRLNAYANFWMSWTGATTQSKNGRYCHHERV
jgi:hypothetical protein